METLQATGAVRGVFFSLANNAEKNNDENLLVVDGADLAADYEKYVFQRILQNETLIKAK